MMLTRDDAQAPFVAMRGLEKSFGKGAARFKAVDSLSLNFYANEVRARDDDDDFDSLSLNFYANEVRACA